MTILDSQLGVGGTGMQGRRRGSVASKVTGFAGLHVDILAGAAAGTKINLAAIRQGDTIAAATAFTSGVPSDITDTMSIADVRASGTLTFASAAADETFVVNGKTFTLVASGANLLAYQVNVGADDTEMAANAAAAINALIGVVDASSALGVVTVNAVVEGTAGNAYTLVGDTHITASAATLEGGTATGGVMSTANNTGKQIQLFWMAA